MIKYRIVTKPGSLGGVFYAVQQTVFGLIWITLVEYGNLEFAQCHMDVLIRERDLKDCFKSEVIRSE